MVAPSPDAPSGAINLARCLRSWKIRDRTRTCDLNDHAIEATRAWRTSAQPNTTMVRRVPRTSSREESHQFITSTYHEALVNLFHSRSQIRLDTAAVTRNGGEGGAHAQGVDDPKPALGAPLQSGGQQLARSSRSPLLHCHSRPARSGTIACTNGDLR